MRHPGVFARAASWDAALVPFVPDARLPGMCETFHTNLHYEPYYCILDLAEDDHVAASLGSAYAAAAVERAQPGGVGAGKAKAQ